jgi:hypothetical protein
LAESNCRFKIWGGLSVVLSAACAEDNTGKGSRKISDKYSAPRKKKFLFAGTNLLPGQP